MPLPSNLYSCQIFTIACVCIQAVVSVYFCTIIWPGKNGEVILENRLDAWYAKVGARLTGNTTLVMTVKDVQKVTRSGRLGEMVLTPELKSEIIEDQQEVARLSPVSTLAGFVYAEFGQVHINHLNGPPEARSNKHTR